jgi:hypothetical protein
MNKVTRGWILFFLFAAAFATLRAQQDNRYDAGMNLPFNAKAGDVNPQTGNITVGFTDVRLPGRAGMDFTFGRMWSLNQSNVFNMYSKDGTNRLNSQTIEKYNRLGTGFSANIPYIVTIRTRRGPPCPFSSTGASTNWTRPTSGPTTRTVPTSSATT